MLCLIRATHSPGTPLCNVGALFVPPARGRFRSAFSLSFVRVAIVVPPCQPPPRRPRPRPRRRARLLPLCAAPPCPRFPRSPLLAPSRVLAQSRYAPLRCVRSVRFARVALFARAAVGRRFAPVGGASAPPASAAADNPPHGHAGWVLQLADVLRRAFVAVSPPFVPRSASRNRRKYCFPGSLAAIMDVKLS